MLYGFLSLQDRLMHLQFAIHRPCTIIHFNYTIPELGLNNFSQQSRHISVIGYYDVNVHVFSQE